MVTQHAYAAAPSTRHIRQELRLSRERMARLVDVSAKTIERWETGEARAESPVAPVAREARERLAKLRDVLDLGRIVYTPEGMQLFLTTPQPRFDGATALQCIERGRIDEVYAALAADYDGLGG